MRITDTLLSPNGRITRATFWSAALAVAALTGAAIYSQSALVAAGLIPVGMGDPLLLGLVMMVPVAWISFCLLVKRWHDRGRSGWWVLVGLVPVLGQVWALIDCGLLPGTAGGNRYGGAVSRGVPLTPHFGEDIPEDMA